MAFFIFVGTLMAAMALASVVIDLIIARDQQLGQRSIRMIPRRRSRPTPRVQAPSDHSFEGAMHRWGPITARMGRNR